MYSDRRMRSYTRVTLLLNALLSAGSCGGKVGETLRPTEHSAQDALQGAKPVTCDGDAKYAKPLIVVVAWLGSHV